MEEVGGKGSHFTFSYLYLYIRLSLFPQRVKYLKTKAIKEIKEKHFFFLESILFLLLLWSLYFCFDTSLLEMMKIAVHLLKSGGKEKINSGGKRKHR